MEKVIVIALMIPLASHAALLAEALTGIGEQNLDLYDVSSYLQMAAGVRRVEFNTFPFDPYTGYCESADDFRANQDKLWGALATRLSVFLFTWAAVEAYKDHLPLTEPPSTPGKKSRQIDKLCYYLASNYKHPLPEKYPELITFFKKVATHADIGRGAAVSTSFPTYMQPAAEGLYLVYEFRNAFAHGDFSAPMPDGDGDPVKHPDVMVVALATRIVLTTLQMITLCLYPSDETVDIPSLNPGSEEVDSEEDKATVLETFLRLHMQNVDEIREQS